MDYLAPGSPPSPNPVTAQASSVALPAKSASAEITVINHDLVSVLPGGVIGHLQARVEEVPAFSREETYLFLRTAPNGTYRILGRTQGAFRIPQGSNHRARIGDAGLRRSSLIRSGHPAVSPWRNPQPSYCSFSGETETSGVVLPPALRSSMADTISQNCPSATAIPYTQNPSAEQSQIGNAMQTLCRNATTDAGWPSQFSCTVPAVNTEFTVRTRPGP